MTRKRKAYDDEAATYPQNVWRPVAIPGFKDYEVADLQINGDKGVVRKISTKMLIGQFMSTW